MDFGMFMEFQTRAGGDENSAFAEGFALAAAAESWGLDAAWLSEFHFSPDRSVLSSPITVASAIAARTERMRIGMAVYVLPLNNPLRIAEEVATVDRISNGRLDLGVGRSGFTYFYLRVPLYAGASEKAATDAARDTLVYYFERQSKLVAADAARRAAASNDAGGDETRRRTAATLAELSYEDILTSRVAVGSPQGLVDRLRQLREELGLDGIVAEMNAGGRLSEEQVLASLRILTHDVMPHFK